MSKRKREFALRGAQLLARGDIIHVMDKGQLLKCRVLSCLGTEDGSCLASLEILEEDRKGQRLETVLRPSDQTIDDFQPLDS
jgi:hypothetical protein